MKKIITIVEGTVPPEQEQKLVQDYEKLSDYPPGLIKTYLLQSKNSNTWQVVTVWESQQALDAMRQSAAKPAAIALFEQVGVTPSLNLFTVKSEKL